MPDLLPEKERAFQGKESAWTKVELSSWKARETVAGT